jgi:hypothetical protein
MDQNNKKNSKDSCFLRFQFKGIGENRYEYGSVQKSAWVDNSCKSETLLWLGKVLNKDEMIFKSRENGIYKFALPNIISPLSLGEIDYYGLSNKGQKQQMIGEELSQIYESPNCLSFGSVYVATEVLRQSELTEMFMAPFSDTKGLGEAAMSLVLYKLTKGGASMHIKDWWNSSCAKYLYPNVNLDSPRISELLKEIGRDKYWRIFFENYSEFLNKQSPLHCALIDSTGLPNSINTNLSQICNHGGVVNREIRLIVAHDKNSGYPLYFKYVPGNIVDKTTLQHIFYEMEAYDIEVDSSIMDADYYTVDNLQFLYDHNVSFVTRYIPNLKVYKRILKNDIHDIDNIAYHVMKEDRCMKIKLINVDDIGEMNLYAYVCKDLVEANKQELHMLKKFDIDIADAKEIEAISEKLRSRGIFVLLSSQQMPTKNILPYYYDRQDIEQIFDFAKNDLDLLPLRVHSESTMRGHLMIVFMATIAHVHMRKMLEKTKNFNLSRAVAFDMLNSHVTVVYPNKNFHMPAIPQPNIRKIYEAFNIGIPIKVDIQ